MNYLLQYYQYYFINNFTTRVSLNDTISYKLFNDNFFITLYKLVTLCYKIKVFKLFKFSNNGCFYSVSKNRANLFKHFITSVMIFLLK